MPGGCWGRSLARTEGLKGARRLAKWRDPLLNKPGAKARIPLVLSGEPPVGFSFSCASLEKRGGGSGVGLLSNRPPFSRVKRFKTLCV